MSLRSLLYRLLLTTALTISTIVAMPTNVLGASVEFRATPNGERLIELPIGLPVFIVVTGANEEPVPDSDRTARVIVMAGAGPEFKSDLLLPLEPLDSMLVGGPILIGTAASHGFQLHKLPAAQGDTIVVQSPLVHDSDLWAEVFSPIFALSTPTCLPGHVFSVEVRLPADIAPLASQVELQIPQNWQDATGSSPPFCQVQHSAAGGISEISCHVHVPTSTPEGVYTIGLLLNNGSDEQVEFSARINLQRALDPHIAVTHWNISENTLDLTVPGAMTLERLRWASSLVGTVLPHTGRKLNKYIVEQWVNEWQANPGSVVWPSPGAFTCVGLLNAEMLISVPFTEAPQDREEPDSAVDTDTERANDGTESTTVPAAQTTDNTQPAGAQQTSDRAPLDRGDVLFNWTSDKDGVKNNVDGVISQASDVSVVDCDGGYAAAFASANSCLVGITSVPVNITGSLTVLAWIRPETDAGRELLVSLSDPESESLQPIGLSLYSNWTENRPAVVLNDGTDRVSFVADKGPKQPSEWHHLAVIIDNGAIQFYVDGEPAGIRETAIDCHLQTAMVWIGQCFPAADPGAVTETAFNGFLRGLLIINRAVDREELSMWIAEQQPGD